jgi:hypothetical protein
MLSELLSGYMNMQPPKYELVVADCDSALALDKRYEKALNRRANALEALERYEEALRGTQFLVLVLCTFLILL